MLLAFHSVFHLQFPLSLKQFLLLRLPQKALLFSAGILIAEYSMAGLPTDLDAILGSKTTTYLNAEFSSPYPLSIKQRSNPIALEKSTLTGASYLSFFEGPLEQAQTLLSDIEHAMPGDNKQVLIDCYGANGNCGFYTVREFMRDAQRRRLFERYDPDFFNLNNHNYYLKLTKIIVDNQNLTQMSLLLVNVSNSSAIVAVDTIIETPSNTNGSSHKGYKMLSKSLPIAASKTIHFANNDHTISADQATMIASFANIIKASGNGKYSIVGHTDNLGSEQQNVQLAQLRAKAVYDELVTKYDISKERLEIIAIGGEKPIASNKSESGRKLNRRVELVLIESKTQ